MNRLKLGRPERAIVFTGLRGVGKTVMLQKLAQVDDHKSFHIITLECAEKIEFAELLAFELRRVLLELDRMDGISELTKIALRGLAGFIKTLSVKFGELSISLDVDPEPGLADSGNIEHDLPQLFSAVGRAAADRKRTVIVLIDEMQYLNENDFSALIMSLHRVAQQGLPITAIGAALPQIRGIAGNAKSYAERLFVFRELQPLTHKDIEQAINKPAEPEGVRFSADAIAEIAARTQGYPYFVQEWAYHTWNAAIGPEIHVDDVVRASDRAIRRLDESFFLVRFQRLTKTEKKYLFAIAKLGPGTHRTSAISKMHGGSTERLGPVRSGLIRKGMIYAPAYGETGFTVPLFDEFLHRIEGASLAAE